MSYFPTLQNRVTTAPNLGPSSDGKNVRLWAGQVISGSNGAWEVDIRGSEFSEVISVVATAQADQSGITAIPFATVRNYGTSSVSGWVIRTATGGILLGGTYVGGAFVTTPTRVFVQVVGY